jgi:hypothetical protein
MPYRSFFQNLWGNIFLLGGLIGISLFVTYRLHDEQVSSWANVPGELSLNVKDGITARLRTLETDGRVKEGTHLPMLQLRGSARNLVNLYVAEANFTEDGIDGIEGWKDLVAQGAVLVNSSDEFRRNDGGLSKSIAAGCGIKSKDPEKDFPDQIGSVFLERCKGLYEKEGVKVVVDAAIVTWGTGPDTGRPKCPGRNVVYINSPYSADAGYTACVTRWINYAITDVFYRRTELGDFPTLIIPALATGHGKIAPEFVYQEYRKIIDDFLAKPELSPQLPKNLILLISRQWVPRVWDYHRAALANLVSELHDRWSIFSGKYRQAGPIATLLGVLLGLIVIVVGVSARTFLLSPLLFSLSESKLTLTLVGWGLGAFGLVAALQAILAPIVGENLLSRFGTEVSVGVGAVAVLIATFVLQVQGLFKDIAKEDSE